MAWSLAQSTKSLSTFTNGVGTLAYGSNVTAGSLLVVATSVNSGSQTVTITDTIGNVWTNEQNCADATNGKSAAVSWAIGKAGGPNTITATWSGATTIGGAIVIHEFTGNAPANVVDGSTKNTNGSASTATDGVVSGNITTIANGDLIFGWTTDASVLTTTITAGTGYTEAQNSGLSATEDCESEYKVQSTAGSVAATWTYSALNPYEAIVVAFRVLSPFFNPEQDTIPRGFSPNFRYPITLRSALVGTLGLDTMFGVAGEPLTPQDIPVPTGAIFPSHLRTFTNPLNQELLQKDQFFGSAGMGPTYDWPNPLQPRRANDLLTNLGISNFPLYASARLPNNVYDWPNPLPTKFSSDLRTFINTIAYQLAGKDQFFGAAGMGPDYDWPNPIPPKFPSDLRTWLQSSNIIAGLDKFFSAQGVGPTYDYPNPLQPRRSVDFLTWTDSLDTETLASIIQLPYNTYDWPNPAPLKFASDQRTFSNSLSLLLLGKDQFFGAAGEPLINQDFPNPLIAGFPGVLRSHIFYYVLDNSAPFFIYDFPNPLIPRFPIDLRTWLLSLNNSTLSPTQQLPPSLLDWPNPFPLKSPSDLRTWLLSLQGSTLNPVQQLPPSLLDWPNPRGAIYSSDLRTFLQPVMLNLLGKDQFFGAPGQPPTQGADWQLPRSTPPIFRQIFMMNLLQSTLTPVLNSIISRLALLGIG
jgi:hypothetical protein